MISFSVAFPHLLSHWSWNCSSGDQECERAAPSGARTERGRYVYPGQSARLFHNDSIRANTEADFNNMLKCE